jgi:hypothetical protein
LITAIAFKICIELLIPKFNIRGRPATSWTGVPMPEAAVNKNRNLETSDGDVGTARQIPPM